MFQKTQMERRRKEELRSKRREEKREKRRAEEFQLKKGYFRIGFVFSFILVCFLPGDVYLTSWEIPMRLFRKLTSP